MLWCRPNWNVGVTRVVIIKPIIEIFLCSFCFLYFSSFFLFNYSYFFHPKNICFHFITPLLIPKSLSVNQAKQGRAGYVTASAEDCVMEIGFCNHKVIGKFILYLFYVLFILLISNTLELC